MLRGLAGYRLLRALAGGGQGEVFLALDTRLKRTVCIKLYHFEDGLRERRRVEREAWRLARIDSANVLDVFDVVARAGRVGLVTRYVPGCDLGRLLQSAGALAPEEAVSIASDLAAALAALRRHGIVHGDLSPQNVLVDGDGRAIIADFGSAVTEGDRPRGVADAARSPEHERGEKLTQRSDFFALGLLLHRMLTGAHPFVRGGADGAIDRRALRRGLTRPPALDGVSGRARAELQTLLRDLLAADPKRRPEGTFELRERLRELRARLPSPRALGGRALATSAAVPAPDLPLRLPARLVRLPWWRRAIAALGNYWYRGTRGARALLLASLAGPLVLAALLLARPGPCVEVALPSLDAGARQLAALPGVGELQVLLTSALRRVAGDAMILGRGPDSDAVLEIRAGGTRNACIADRHIAFTVGCSSGMCDLELTARRGEGWRRGQLALSTESSRRELFAAIEQLVSAQADFILAP